MSKIVLTVALPLYRSRKIAWLALESLGAQVHPGCAWELIICEESNADEMGQDGVFAYRDRLRVAGCESIAYFPQSSKLSLPNKWRKMAQEARGEGFVLHAGDCYSQPHRLVETLALLRVGAEWIDSPHGYFYDIPSATLGVFDVVGRRHRHVLGLDMCVRTELIADMPESEQERGIDSLLLANAVAHKGSLLRTRRLESDTWRAGLNTTGENHISLTRARGMGIGGEPERPYRSLGVGDARTLREILPAPSPAKLEGMRTP